MNDRVADVWAETTWGEIEAGDFVKVSGVIFRVDRKSEELDLAGKYAFVLRNREGVQEGCLLPSKPVSVRTIKNDEKTPAAYRFDGLSKAGEAALKAKLGAELIAHGEGSAFDPFIMPERYASQDLASHLSMFHNLYTGQVKQQDGIELRKTHREFHAAGPKSFVGQRVPHVHDEKAFEKGMK